MKRRRSRFDVEAARRDYLAGTMNIDRDLWRYDLDRVQRARAVASGRVLKRKLAQWSANKLG